MRLISRAAALAAMAALGLIAGCASAEDSTLEDGAKDAGRAIGTAAREVGKGAKKIGKAVGEAAKEGAEAVKEGAKEFKRAVKDE